MAAAGEQAVAAEGAVVTAGMAESTAPCTAITVRFLTATTAYSLTATTNCSPAAPLPQPQTLQLADETLSMPAVIAHIQGRDYGCIAVALARYTYFGRNVMRISTIAGADKSYARPQVTAARYKIVSRH